uniref:Egg protein CP3842 n=1 Tax=Schistosoma japonicum TaxID=6182 RepID=C1LM57_SCHJA|nr:hypothetical protein [Schistosoma japonicum]
MRIINLVNISTVLLLINLLQTKSLGHGNQYGSELKVTINAQLKDKRKNDLVMWDKNYQDGYKPEYKKHIDEICKLLFQFSFFDL